MINKLKTLLVPFFALIGGLLGAFAGTNNTSKNWRRVGIPLLLTLCALFILHNWWCILIMTMTIGLSLGYAIPSHSDPKGSTIGGFFYKVFKGNNLLANIFTRGSVCLVIMLSLLVIPILKGNWSIYGLCILANLIVFTTLSWRNLGMFKFKNKLLLISEFITYTVLVGSTKILIG